MAKQPAGKKPAPRKTTPKKPAARKTAAGKATPARKAPTPKKAPVKKPATRAKATAKPKTTAGPVVAPQQAETQDTSLNLKQQRFVDEYLIDLNGTKAAIRAGYSPATAEQIAYQLLQKTSVQAAITEGRRLQQERTQITADRVLREIVAVAVADPRELVEVKTGCCRNCYGEGHKYQRTVGEMNRDREAWREKGKNPAEFDEGGGIGFDALKQPHPECPFCGGDGMARTVLKDTRYLSPGAVALYAGAKQTKEGIEIKMHSKMDAIEKLAKHLGMYEKDNQQKTDPLAALLQRLASGNGNALKPVADDPEAPQPSGSNTLMPRAGDDDDHE